MAESSEKTEAEISDAIEAKLAEWNDEGLVVSEEPADEMRQQAFNVVKSDINLSGGGSADTETVPMLALGYRMETGLADYGIRAAGVINPDDGPAGVATFLIDGDDGVDIDHAKRSMRPLETCRVAADVRRCGTYDNTPTIKKGGAPAYVMESTEDTVLEQVDPADAGAGDPIADLPADREPKREMIHQNFITEADAVTLQNFADHVATENANGWAAGLGVDIKRFRGNVVDGVQFEESGLLTLSDDTIMTEADVPDELVSDQMRTPGLQVDMVNELMYGEGSVLDVYGYLIQRDDGQYRMMAFGAIPIVEFPYDGDRYEDAGSDGADDEAIEEDTI
ncbi:hypothetical protein Z052_01945 [Halorubrum sp. C191]|nr:hypothetical protein Z052_01945 [Halorubrum sp. C191]